VLCAVQPSFLTAEQLELGLELATEQSGGPRQEEAVEVLQRTVAVAEALLQEAEVVVEGAQLDSTINRHERERRNKSHLFCATDWEAQKKEQVVEEEGATRHPRVCCSPALVEAYRGTAVLLVLALALRSCRRC
jgi:2-phospho-L-lactate guanylyltransferase (CobY/MobA/RfbA family)